MNTKEINFVQANQTIFVNGGNPTQAIREEVYRIYNAITGSTKKPNGCGRCWRNVRRRVWAEYLKTQQEL